MTTAYVDLRSFSGLPRRRMYLALCWLVIGALDEAEAVWRWAQRAIVRIIDVAEGLARPLLLRSPGKHRDGFPASILCWATVSGVDPSSVIMAQRRYRCSRQGRELGTQLQ